MPKLDKATAKAVNDTEGSSFAPLDDGIYFGKLLDVTEAGPGPSGSMYWRWEFGDLVNVATSDAAPGRQWLNTSLSEAAQWKLKETFEAFGVAPGTDTDTLLGNEVRLAISQRVIEAGARVGEMGNQIDRVMPLTEEDLGETG